jgi:hypothetical protein
LTLGFCLVLLIVVALAGGMGAGKNWNTADREGLGPDHGRTKAAYQRRTEEPQDLRRVCFQLTGEATTALQNRYGYFGAADEKVPLLMVCVKRKPLHLVFYLRMGESRFIIPGFCLWRMAGRRIQSGFGGFGGVWEV